MTFPWIKNTQGEPSASLTMAIISFISITLWLLIWLVATPFGVSVPAFDATTAMAYLTPILLLYFGRRHDSPPEKKSNESSSNDSNEA